MTTLPPLNELNALTRQGITFLTTLDSLLDQEYKALQERSLEQLQALVEQKTSALQQLEENNQRRNQLFVAAGITPDKEGLKAFSSQLPEADATSFTTLWGELEKILRQVNDKNKRNEVVISRNSRNLEKLLSIVRGQNQKNMIYDQSGEKGNYTAQSRIGKA